MLLQAVVLPWAIFICVAWLLSSSVATSVQFDKETFCVLNRFNDGPLIYRFAWNCGMLQFERDYHLGIGMITYT